MLAPSPWWRPGVHADRRPFLLARGRIISGLRGFFAERGFIEVECGALQVSPGNETHLHGMSVELIAPDLSTRKLYLHTSPEFACKKLLAAGEERIFDLARVYRNRERSRLHAPEFTMLEWYRAREAYGAVMADAVEIVRTAAGAAGTHELRYRGIAADPFAVPERLTVAEAFHHYAGIDLLSTLDQSGAPDRPALARAAIAAGIRIADNDTWSDVFSRLLAERVEPHLGHGRLTLLDEYPAAEAALAQPSAKDPRVAERFELYVCGVELANGFGELTATDEQRRRFEAEMDEKARIYGERYPLDEDFLAALAAMPPASGVALGLDRLVMLATGAERIEQVLWTPMP